MGDGNAPIVTSCDELSKSLEKESSNAQKYYARAATSAYGWWRLLQIISILSGFAAAIIAALVEEDVPIGQSKVLLIIIPALGSLAATLLSFFKIYDKWHIYQEGQLLLNALIEETGRRKAAANSQAECAAIHKEFLATKEKIKGDLFARSAGLVSPTDLAKYVAKQQAEQ